MKETIDSIALRGNVDYGILTIREDEAKAVLNRLDFSKRARGLRTYDIARVLSSNGQHVTVAHLRCPSSQGPSEAREAASALIRDLEPTWLIVVGIAGTVPNEDVCLGDVVISSAIYDSRLMASNNDGTRSFAMNKERLHQRALDFVAQLPGMEDELGEWYFGKSLSLSRPTLPKEFLAKIDNGNIKGSSSWKERVLEALNVHFGRKTSRPNHPVARAVPFLSSSELVKDPSVVERWLIDARDFKAIEMELIGVHEACNEYPVGGNNVPLISIRGISDVVGLRRQSAWTHYACESAAAFTVAAIKSGNLESRNRSLPSKTAKRSRTVRDPISLLQFGNKSITPKLASESNVSPYDVFNQLAFQTLGTKKVTICWNVRPVPVLGLIHIAYLQQLARFREWGFRVRVVIYDVCTADYYDGTQIATITRSLGKKIRSFKGLKHASTVVAISELLRNRSATDVISTLFSLGRPAIGEAMSSGNDPATSLDNLLSIAVERWNAHHILLAGARDSNDFWTNYRAQLAASGMRSEFPSLILDFPKLSIGQPLVPEDMKSQPNENDTVEAITKKLESITPKEIEEIASVLFWSNGSAIQLPSNASELALAIHHWFRSLPNCFHPST